MILKHVIYSHTYDNSHVLPFSVFRVFTKQMGNENVPNALMISSRDDKNVTNKQLDAKEDVDEKIYAKGGIEDVYSVLKVVWPLAQNGRNKMDIA